MRRGGHLSLLCASVAVSLFYHNTASDMHRVVSVQTHNTKAALQAFQPRGLRVTVPAADRGHVFGSRAQRSVKRTQNLQSCVSRTQQSVVEASMYICIRAANGSPIVSRQEARIEISAAVPDISHQNASSLVFRAWG